MNVESINCLSCGSGSIHTIWDDSCSGEIVQCEACGLAFFWPPRTYDYDNGYQSNRLSGRYDHTLDWERLDEIRSMEPSGVLLDAGCGFGHFLHKARSLGYEVLGIEPTSAASEYARDELGLTIIQSRIEESKITDESLSVLTCWHVLEHLKAPDEVLLRFHQWLQPGGVLAIEVPNELGGILHWITTLSKRGGWTPYTNPPCHLFYYTVDSLVFLMEQAGYEVVHKETRRFAPSHLFWDRFEGWAFARTFLDRVASLFGTGAMIRVFARK